MGYLQVHDAGRKLMDTTCRPWSLCENLGAVESIITCPSVMTHANMLAEDRLKVGITTQLTQERIAKTIIAGQRIEKNTVFVHKAKARKLLFPGDLARVIPMR